MNGTLNKLGFWICTTTFFFRNEDFRQHFNCFDDYIADVCVDLLKRSGSFYFGKHLLIDEQVVRIEWRVCGAVNEHFFHRDFENEKLKFTCACCMFFMTFFYALVVSMVLCAHFICYTLHCLSTFFPVRCYMKLSHCFRTILLTLRNFYRFLFFSSDFMMKQCYDRSTSVNMSRCKSNLCAAFQLKIN